MKKDILNRSDIELLIQLFYKKVLEDDLLSPIFNEKVLVHWERHIPLMVDFWENTLFFSGSYKGNPMTLHQHLNKVHALDQSHFNRWLLLFTTTIDKHFKGANASIAKRKAKKLASILSGMITKA
ncbi:MAG: hemoglobin-like protein [Chitinophagaceae bacterium BSSC1]|nr:MAG: hemoglobin-like protein [Chitinophagaceae bacterium BSSC1]